jgi:TPR repeat protein
MFAHRDSKYELGVENCCPFCRDPVATTDTERLKKTEERLKHGDCEAYYMLGARYLEGTPPFKQNTKKSVELLNQAAELGSEAAHHTLGMVYAFGKGKVVKKDEKKGLYHLRLAAIGGMLESRHILGEAYLQESPKLAYKHFLIAAEAGHDESLKKVKTGYAEGHVEKDVFENANRAHKAANNEVKSEARDKAAEWWRRQSAGKK